MKRVKPWRAAGAAAVLLLAGVVVWRATANQGDQGDAAAPASALVTVAPVRADQVRETVDAYGVIGGSAASSRTLAAPRAVIVDRVLVTAGAAVAAGTPLMVLHDAPSTTQSYHQAAAAESFAERDLARVQRLFDEHLAAGDQLSAAQKTLADARTALAALAATGAGVARQTLTVPFAGVVAALPVAAGDHVSADAPLMTLVAGDGLVAQLGVEPQRAAGLRAGQAVSLTPVFHSELRLDSRLGVVTRQVDPTSRMIDATAPAAADWPLGEAVRGEITVASHPGLLAPRAAIVFDENGSHLFVVAGGKARQIAVKTGAEQGDDVEVSGSLRAGDQVAVQGAYELQDGMAVRIARP